jgi:hypothetical protein
MPLSNQIHLQDLYSMALIGSFCKSCNGTILRLRGSAGSKIVAADQHKDIGDARYNGEGDILRWLNVAGQHKDKKYAGKQSEGKSYNATGIL